MKNSLYLLLFAIAFASWSCTSKKSSHTDQLATADSSKTVTDVATIEDPDPTDSIPAERYGINCCSKTTAEVVRKALTTFYKEDLEKNFIEQSSRKFIFFEYDLNGDNKKEIFVGLTGGYFCGSGGCTFLILDNVGNKVSSFTVSDYPIVIDSKYSKGWKNLFIQSNGKFHVVKYNGKKYPSNPSIEPVLKLIPGDDLPRALNFINEPYPWFTF